MEEGLHLGVIVRLIVPAAGYGPNDHLDMYLSFCVTECRGMSNVQNSEVAVFITLAGDDAKVIPLPDVERDVLGGRSS